MMEKQEILELLRQYIDRSISSSDLQQLQELFADENGKKELKALFNKMLANTKANAAIIPADWKDMHLDILSVDKPVTAPAIFHPNTSHKRRWIAAAAILILAIGSGIYYLNNQSYKSHKSSQITLQTDTDIAPGGNKAIWILSDGKQVELDSSVLDMTEKKKMSDNIGYNELRTPRGGQYQLILPDGSKVWLNASSSIRYPVVFSDKERRVVVTGEVYFEIAKNSKQPFIVATENTMVQVLGTSFNINAYGDENAIKTTLLDGSVKITAGNQQTILSPGQQAVVTTNITVDKSINTEQVIAWKNGLFNFEGVGIRELMRQVERWYNVEVIYPKQMPSIVFVGSMERSASLPDLLEGLEKLGVHSRIEAGRRVVILP